MYILVDKKKLDLTNSNISVKRTNNAFAWGKYTLSRTQTFNVPKTPNNLAILGLARLDIYGTQERKKYDAELVEGVVVYQGLLHITEVTPTMYKCTFVYGDLLSLKKLSEIKKISEVLEEQTIVIGDTKKANASNINFVDNVLYLNKNVEYKLDTSTWSYSRVMPSIEVAGIIERINANLDVQLDANVISRDYRIILNKFGGSKKTGVVLAKTDLNTIAPNSDLKNVITIDFVQDLITCTTGNRGSYNVIPGKFFSMKGVSLTFPQDFPEDLFLVADYTHYEPWDGFVKVDLEFFGDYSFDWAEREVTSLSGEGTRATKGLPLAGKVVEVSASSRTYYNATNTQSVNVFPRISFYRKTDFHNTTQSGESINHYKGFFNGDASPFSFTFSVEKDVVKNALGNPNTALLLDNLPDISPLDLYTAMAVLQGKFVVLEDGVITMQTLDYGEEIELRDVEVVDSINRQGPTSGQHNLISFKNSDVPEEERIIVDYTTENENLDAEKKIYTFPFAEGVNVRGNIFLNDIREVLSDYGRWYNFDVQSKEPSIAIANANSELMQRVPFGTNMFLEQIYFASTKVSLSCRMNFLQYSQIKENTIFLYNGKRYIWSDAQFKNNNVKFTLYAV